MSTDQTHNDTQAIVDVALASAEPSPLAEGRDYVVMVPAGGHVERIDNDLDIYRDRPRRKVGRVVVHDAASFVAYLDKHAVADTEVWADVPAARLVGVVNAHGPSDASVAERPWGRAGWGDHRVDLVLHPTPAWKAWAAKDRVMLGQVDFAEHVEDRLVDFVAPTGADMLELAQSFHATRSVKFDSSQRLASSETQLRYHEETEAKAGRRGDLAIPDTFELGLTPFEGAPAYRVTARLRYRITDGVLRLGYVLDRPEDVLRSAFLDIVEAVEQRIDQTVLRGAPNA